MKAEITKAVITWEGLTMSWAVRDDGGRLIYETQDLIERQAQESNTALVARGRAAALADTNRVKNTYEQGGRDVLGEIEPLD